VKQNEANHDNTKRFADYEDNLWRVIMFDYAKHEGKELFEENEIIKNDPQYKPSDAERKKFHKLLDKSLRRHKIRSLLKTLKKMFIIFAIVVLALILIYMALFTFVEAFRIEVSNFFLTFEKKPEPITLSGNSGNAGFDELIAAGLRNTHAPSYIPEGYWIDEISDMGDGSKIITYINDDGEDIDFWELDPTMKTNIDTENADIIKYILINEKEGLFVLKKDLISISWSNDDKVFLLMANISEEEIMKIAESVIIIE